MTAPVPPAAGRHPFLRRVHEGPPILADGAMGTELYERVGFRSLCFEELNVSNPELVQRVHRDYLSAGAELIETNTFSCNRISLTSRGLEQQAGAFARAGVRIAREAQEAMGVEAFVAGSVGPINRIGVSPHEVRDAFQEVVEGLLLGGVDLFIFETFGSLEELLIALAVCRACSDLPLVASMTFAEDGTTLAGEPPETVSHTLQEAGADVVSANCGFGPQPTLEVIDRMRFEGGPAFGAMPNAGLPARVDGRLVYSSSPEYFAEYAELLTRAGVRVVGGCCGTTPTHIRHMGQRIVSAQIETDSPSARTSSVLEVQRPVSVRRPDQTSTPGTLADSVRSGEFIISVEMRPSRGGNPAKVLRAAEMLRDAGVTAVDVTDSAMARVRMGPIPTAYLIEARVGVEVIVHMTTRDRNLMALQADLLGAHALGLRNILALTGDPPNANSFAPTSGVYDVDSIGLITLIKMLNEGQDASGRGIGVGTDFFIGCSLNPTADDLELELDRFYRKVEAGADFVMTQAVYDSEQFLATLDRIKDVRLPVILELLPLQSFKNAEFIHNELPGVTLPPHILERMRDAGNRSIEEGMRIATETFEQLRSYVQGIYIIPSFDRYEQAALLTRQFRNSVASPSQEMKLQASASLSQA